MEVVVKLLNMRGTTQRRISIS